MAKLSIKPGSTDVTQYIFVQASNKNEGRTGLLYNTSGLKCYYLRTLGSATVVPLATQTIAGAHSDGGFVQIDATNMPGVYRLDLPDAVCAAGVRSAIVQLSGASNMTPLPMEIDLNSEVNVTHVNATTQTAGDIAAELAKVPKSDSNVSWNATALGAIDTTLTATHGTGSWQSASAGVGTADINTVWDHATRTITGGTANTVSGAVGSVTALGTADIDTALSAVHGTGDWSATGTGGAGTADINTALSAIHGAGSWVEASPSEITISTAVWAAVTRTITGGTADLVTAVTNGVTLANGAVTAGAIATGAIDADALATDAVTEIQGGLAMGTATTAILGYVDDLETRLTATRAGYLDNLSGGVIPTAAAIADAVHDEVVEGTLTLRQIERIQLAALAGESSGGGTGTLTFSDVAGTAARITATVDSTGNRTAITLDGA
jgi:hypothetical protein